MKSDTILQEILLVANNRFTRRPRDLSKTEDLEKACWNGRLEELLPGIVEKSSSGKKLCLWQIRQGDTYLQIELCEYPVRVEKQFSIDPCIFLNFRRSN